MLLMKCIIVADVVGVTWEDLGWSPQNVSFTALDTKFGPPGVIVQQSLSKTWSILDSYSQTINNNCVKLSNV